MAIFAVATFYIDSETVFHLGVTSVDALNTDEAEGRVRRELMETYPPADGFYDHETTAGEITEEIEE